MTDANRISYEDQGVKGYTPISFLSTLNVGVLVNLEKKTCTPWPVVFSFICFLLLICYFGYLFSRLLYSQIIYILYMHFILSYNLVAGTFRFAVFVYFMMLFLRTETCCCSENKISVCEARSIFSCQLS